MEAHGGASTGQELLATQEVTLVSGASWPQGLESGQWSLQNSPSWPSSIPSGYIRPQQLAPEHSWLQLGVQSLALTPYPSPHPQNILQ